MGSFLFKWPYPASGDVYVTGSFDDWGKTQKLNKVGDVYEKEVELPYADKKITYKFVVNENQWVIDDAAPKEDDGHYNVNNILLPENIKKSTHSSTGAAAAPSVVSGPSSGAPLLTKEQSEANLARGVPSVDAPANRPVVRSLDEAKADLPSTGAGTVPGSFPDTPANEASVNPIPATGHDNTQSSVTTSKEDYEKAGEGAGAGGNTNETVSVAPIPATGHDNINSSVTTSKEDYEKSGSMGTAILAGAGGAAALGAGAGAAALMSKNKENMIPESSLPVGADAGKGMDASPFISSSGPGTTTADLASKVPLESERRTPFVSSSGPGTTTGDLASKVPLGDKRKGMFINPKDAPAASVPEVAKESLSEAHQSPEAAASANVVSEKSAVEKELMSKVPESEATGAPASAAAAQSSYHGLATSVPETVEESMSKAHAAPEAASDAAVVAEKTAVEKELLNKIPSSEAAGEPAPTIAAATSTTAPTASTSAATAAKIPDRTSSSTAVKQTTGAGDSSLADEPAVQMMAQNEGAKDAAAASTTAGNATGAKVDTPTAAKIDTPTAAKVDIPTAPETPKKADSKLPETPKKDAAVGSAVAGTTSTASTPAKKIATDSAASSPATTSKSGKKKNRLSRIWHKIVD